MNDHTKDTLSVYDGKAQEYANLVSDIEDADLAPFLAALPKAGHVLDFGCGPGHFAARMAAAGFRVIATDGSQEMINIAGQHAGVEARLARFEDINDGALYDGIWANFSLLHAPRATMPDHLSRLHTACKPRARFHIGMKLGTGEGPDALGRYYTYYSQEELDTHLIEAGFTVLTHRFGTDKGLSGSIDDWVTIAAHA